jgi:putative transposase
VQTGVGPVGLAVPRDRAGTFEPLLIPKRSGRVAGGLDDMIISLYAHGMSVRDILHHLEQVYGTQLSAETVSRITDQVLEEVRAWQARPLDPVYAVVFLDAIVVKVRDNQVVQNKPAYTAVGIDGDGEKHVLGIWLAKTAPDTATAGEGARFWNSVMTDLRNRGVRDILIACCDGLAGFEDAITSAFPGTVVQRCVVHLIRNALRPVARRDAGEVAKELRAIYTAPDAEAAFDALAAFAASPWGKKYPRAVRVWEDAWDAFTPFLAFSPAVRKLLYTTNAIESLNYQLRKVTKARGHFPNDDAVVKLLWLAIINIEDKRARERAARRQQTGKRSDQPARLVEGQRVMGWREALNELDDAYPGRLR